MKIILEQDSLNKAVHNYLESTFSTEFSACRIEWDVVAPRSGARSMEATIYINEPATIDTEEMMQETSAVLQKAATSVPVEDLRKEPAIETSSIF